LVPMQLYWWRDCAFQVDIILLVENCEYHRYRRRVNAKQSEWQFNEDGFFSA
jgi:hypothetical protein